jgi:SP family galactose:H+ symporter-like MFS transporter
MADVAQPTSAERSGFRRRLRRIVVLAALGGLLFGYDTGVISGALLFIQDEFHLTPFQEGAVVSGLLLGAVVGALGVGRFADHFGRRVALIATAIIFTVGIAIAAAAPSTGVLIAGRFVLGLAVGAGSVTVPMFLSELAPPDERGRIVSMNQLMITVGIFVAYCVDYAFAGARDWRAMFAVGAIPSLALLIGMLKAPESPRWLVANERADDAREVVHGGYPEETIDSTFSQWEDELRSERESRGWRELLDQSIRPALVVGLGLAAIQQFGGINTIIYYAPKIMEQTGLKASSAILYSIAIAVINVGMTLVAIRFVDRSGRRRLLQVSLIGMTVSLALLGLAFSLGGTSTGTSLLALACILVYICAFAVGLGPVFWLLIAEIYPQHIRGAAMSAATAVNWLSNFVVALLFPVMLAKLGNDVTFWIYAGICVLAYVFVQKLVPETKERTLEDIQRDLSRDGRRGRERPQPTGVRPTGA